MVMSRERAAFARVEGFVNGSEVTPGGARSVPA